MFPLPFLLGPHFKILAPLAFKISPNSLSFTSSTETLALSISLKPAAMANTRVGKSSAKRSSASSQATVQKRSYMCSSSASFALQLPSTTSSGALALGMGFNTLPPLLIISIIFGFLTFLNLRKVGIDLGVVSRWVWLGIDVIQS